MTEPSGQRDAVLRAEDFLTAFNEIERELKRRTGVEDHEGFRTAAHRFVERNGWWRQDFEAMLSFADLRNVIVHDRFRRFAYLSIPTAEVVAEIRAVRDRLLEPRTAYHVFQREVETAQASDSLASLLARVQARQFTHFPVYEGRTFLGLVTGNGITHWLARELDRADLSLLDFEEREVRELFELEETRPNCRFMSRSAPVDEVAFAFAENPQLEAVLVTQDGRSDQKLLGIATQWDIAALPPRRPPLQNGTEG